LEENRKRLQAGLSRYERVRPAGIPEPQLDGFAAVRYKTLYDNVLYYAAVLAHEELQIVVQLPHTCCLGGICAIAFMKNQFVFWIDRCCRRTLQNIKKNKSYPIGLV
jgi:hypothetical protein